MYPLPKLRTTRRPSTFAVAQRSASRPPMTPRNDHLDLFSGIGRLATGEADRPALPNYEHRSSRAERAPLARACSRDNGDSGGDAQIPSTGGIFI
jgi:hypothetical protein